MLSGFCMPDVFQMPEFYTEQEVLVLLEEARVEKLRKINLLVDFKSVNGKKWYYRVQDIYFKIK